MYVYAVRRSKVISRPDRREGTFQSKIGYFAPITIVHILGNCSPFRYASSPDRRIEFTVEGETQLAYRKIEKVSRVGEPEERIISWLSNVGVNPAWLQRAPVREIVCRSCLELDGDSAIATG